jgi:integrase
MARRSRAARLETRTARLKLAIRKKPYDFTSISPGISLAYRRCASAGRWVVKVADGRGGTWTKVVGFADDHEDKDGETVLDFFQAQDRARALARGKDSASGRPATLDEAIDDYRADLIARGGSTQNASSIRFHMPATLLSKPVSMLTSRELRHWRDSMLANGMKPATLLRLIKAVRACLNLAARHDKRITNRDAWGDSLGGIADTHNPRNAILNDEQVRAAVAAAYAIDAAFGVYAETMATTGARQSQIARLEIADLQDDSAAPRLLMPSSRKGRNRRAERKPVPITPGLAAKLRAAAGDRAPTAPLLLRADGNPWQPLHSDHLRLFALAAERAGLGGHTMYALRHSSIVRALLANVPIRLVADHHDTSVVMIEKTYSRYIAGHGDALIRCGLLDLSPPAAANVVTIAGRRS